MVAKGKGFMMHCSQVVTCTDNKKYVDTFAVFHCHFVEVPKISVYTQVRLEVMGKKAKNATYICGNEAGKISREVAKVEKRRTVKSTLFNERSSRSHCMVGCIQLLRTFPFLRPSCL
jgi:hypothetical protein